MARKVVLPPPVAALDDGAIVGGWWHVAEDGRLGCDLCPRECQLRPGDRGFCFVRENRDGQMVLNTYGRSTGFCIDPIEKKPLNHFYPGTSVLSFGTAGCNLGCKFCQNWSISKSREVERLSESAIPAAIARAAESLQCRSVAFTYNDPIVWAEYAIDTARECRAVGIKTVAVTAGYITPEARGPFFRMMDAANVDLKAFTERFYEQLTLSHLQPVLDTLTWLRQETDVWFELTNLVIPEENDGDDEFRRMCDWILANLGADIPVHFTAFHPDFRLRERPPTPPETLLRARSLALQAGLHYVYVGNVDDQRHQSTYCPQCGEVVIERNWYELGRYRLTGNRCEACGHTIPGHFAEDTGPGTWGRRRQPVDMRRYAAVHQPSRQEPTPVTATSPTATDLAGIHVGCPELNVAQERAVLAAASELVAAAVQRRTPRLEDPTLAGAAELPISGCFVSLKRKGQLRGCCGFLGRRSTVLQGMAESAKTSATGDVRMPSVVAEELAHLELEVWLLHGQRPLLVAPEERTAAVEIGRHGLQIQRGEARGLLLPGVATDHQMSSETFLQQVCLKAGLPAAAWRDPDVQLATFEGRVVKGGFVAELLSSTEATSLLLTHDEVQRLADFCRDNVVAVARGAVPTYFLPGCTDGAVHGLHLVFHFADDAAPLDQTRIVLRNPMPLQSSLFQMCETLGHQLQASSVRSIDLRQVSVELGILYEPALHGTADAPDLAGVDPRRRALLVTQHTKSAWRFDPQLTPEQLLSVVLQQAEITLPESAQVFSMVVQSNRLRLQMVHVPRGRLGGEVRPPAVAGTFYPAEPGQLQAMLDELQPREPVQRERWRAALVPHAGLVYSGRLAADVLRRIEIPRRVIVLGPKHTAAGVDWAVAPQRTWALPGINVASDPAYARKLAAAIRGLQLDELAHRREHAIEVELPWIARFAPESQVIGIALGQANLSLCQRFAEEFAELLREDIDQTLLVISSDMNHYASDAETRRIDRMALDALQSLDPDQLFHTVRDHNISMCGVLPACIVLGTLRRLGLLNECSPVGYGTSADVSGDPTRVVGYAGMLFR